MPIVNVPGVGQVRFPDDMSQEDIINAIETDILKKPAPGFIERSKQAFQTGLEQIPESLAGIELGGRAALGQKEEAGRQAAAIRAQEQQQKPIAPISYEELEKTYGKDGAIEVLKKLPSYISEQILQSAPSMAVPLAAAAAVTPFTSPLGGLLTGVGTYGAQQFGQFMRRQAAEGATGETLAPGKAAAFAAATAPIGFFADKFLIGLGKFPPKILGSEALAELAKRTGQSLPGRITTGATLGVIAEAPTEVLEQMAERYQAGLPLDTEDAYKEYKEAFAGAAAVGGVGGAAARGLAGKPAIPPEREEPKGLPTPMETLPLPIFSAPPQGMTADRALGLREEAIQADEQRRLAQQMAEEQRMADAQERARSMQGFATPAGGNLQMMGQVRTDQQAAIKQQQREQAAAEKARQKQIQDQINEINNTVYSTDPVANQITKQRLLDQFAQQQPQDQVIEEAPAEITPVKPTAMSQMAGFASPATTNQQMLDASRKRQADEIKAAETAKKKRIKEIENTVFSPDPLANELAKRKILEAEGLVEPEKEAAPEVLAEEGLEPPPGPVAYENIPGQKAKPPVDQATKEEDRLTLKALKEQEKEIRSQIFHAKRSGTNLRRILAGRLDQSELSEFGDKNSDADKKLISNTGGASLDDIVSDGLLNEFLPPNLYRGTDIEANEIAEESADKSFRATEYIRNLLQTNQNMPFQSQQIIQQANLRHDEVLRLIDRYLSTEEINIVIQEAIDDEARIDQAAREAATEGENRTAGRGKETAGEKEVKEEKPRAGKPPVLDESGVTPAKGRHPQMQAALQKVMEGKMTREEFKKYAQYYKPIELIEQEKLEAPASNEKMFAALRGEDSKAKLNTPIPDGTRVGLRMDLPARDAGANVVSVHVGKPNKDPKTGKPYKSAGQVIGYQSAAHITDVEFAPRDQEKSAVMGILPKKEPLQTAEGNLVNASPEEIYKKIKELMSDPAWTQVGFDPTRHGYFYSRKNEKPVVSASELYQVGNFLLAKNAQFGHEVDYLYSTNKGGEAVTINPEAKRIQDELTGKSFIEMAQWTVKNARNEAEKHFAQKGLNVVRALEKQGVEFIFEVQGGNSRNSRLYRAQGVASFLAGKDAKGTQVRIDLNGVPVLENQLGYPSGMNYETVLHEFMHTATRLQNRFLPATHPAVKELNSLFRTVVAEFNKQVRNKTLPESMMKVYKDQTNNLESPDELLAWGLEDRDFQKWLSTIKVGDKTAFEKIVEVVRRMLGISPEFESALDRLMKTTNEILDIDVQDIDTAMRAQGVQLGAPKPKAPAKPPKPQAPFQESLFKQEANTPAFKRWFGDSKVVNAEGKPLVVYHGTRKDFNAFDKSKQDLRDAGFYFGSSKDANAYAYSSEGGGNVIPVYLSISNPKIYYNRDVKITPKLIEELKSQGYDGVKRDFAKGPDAWRYGEDAAPEWVAFEPTQIKSAIGNKGTFDPNNPDILSKGAGTPNSVGQQAMEILSGMGRDVKPPEPGYKEKIRQSWDNAKDNPKATAEAARDGFRRFSDQVQTWAFSSDAALNNQIRREVMGSMLGQEEKIGLLLNTSLSQTFHSDAIANLFLRMGNVKYNKELHKWEGIEDKNNFITLSQKLDEIGAKYGLDKAQIELVAHTAFEAKRTKSLVEFNTNLDAQVQELRDAAAEERAKGNAVKASALSEKASSMKEKAKFIHMDEADIQAGLSQFKLMPELNQAVEIWNGIRGNAVDKLVESGLWTPDEAEFLLSNADYVPFFREDQLENGKGPKEFMRSLQVQAKERRLKGSAKPVNDIFDNMIRWTQYAVNRSVRNRSALSLATTAESVGLARKVEGTKDGDNVVRVWDGGQEQYYDMEDPMFMEAFQGLESVSIPTIRWMAKMADILRSSVVLNPLFALSQVPQDSFAAMFSSGLKPQFALTIPVRAVKEFIQTLRGKSTAHEELKNFGVVGVRDFSSAMVRLDTEIAAGLKPAKGLWGKVKDQLSHFAMASDNAVRQATYTAALDQGLSKAEALEKAFEIFNVRRRGTSKMLNFAGQVIPFFNAYLAAQNVAYRTITGVGTSPTQRDAAYKVLFGTTASVFALSVLYAMMNGDDEDYMSKPTPTRDRLLMIPGTGMSIPLRADLYALPKVVAEHTYMILTDKGYSDGAKFRASLKSLLATSILSPTPVPQAVKPLAEVLTNYDFFQQKPLVGTYQKKKEIERQFDDNTSELAKVFGQSGLISPIAVDHLVRGLFGSAGGLVLYATNPFLWHVTSPNTPRPSVSMQDALATIPNASGFVTKEYETGLKKDFFALKEEVDRAANTLTDLKQRNPEDIKDYIKDEKVRARLGLSPIVNTINTQLSTIRKSISTITNSTLPADVKAARIKQLRATEENMLKNVDLKKLREMAKI